MIIAGVVGAAFMMITSSDSLAKAKALVEEKKPLADGVAATAASADVIIVDAQGPLRNSNLAKSMIAHNTVYPDLFDTVKRYVPPFYRLTSMAATPSADGATSTITLVGTLDTFQEYNDLALALLRMPKVSAVARAGFAAAAPYRPGLSPADQRGTPHLPGEAPVPDDQLQRLAYFQATAKPSGYLNTGNFGAENTDTRGAMPNSSLVTVRLTIAIDTRTPNPRATLATAAAPAPAAAGAPTTTTSSVTPPPGKSSGAASSSKKSAADDSGDEDVTSGKKGKKASSGG